MFWHKRPTRAANHKPSARVSLGLPDALSFQVRKHAMVARRSGPTFDGESVRVGLPSSLTRRLGDAMPAYKNQSPQSSSLHLIVERLGKMIETIDADETETGILKVGDDKQRDGHRRRKDHHMDPAAVFCPRHAEACKQ